MKSYRHIAVGESVCRDTKCPDSSIHELISSRRRTWNTFPEGTGLVDFHNNVKIIKSNTRLQPEDKRVIDGAVLQPEYDTGSYGHQIISARNGSGGDTDLVIQSLKGGFQLVNFTGSTDQIREMNDDEEPLISVENLGLTSESAPEALLLSMIGLSLRERVKRRFA